MRRNTGLKIILVVCLALLVVGCAEKGPELRAFWPALPAKPHLEWLGVYASEADFKRTQSEKNIEALTGRTAFKTFRKPTGIVGDSERGLVFVADGGQHNIRVYDFNNRTVSFLSEGSIGAFPTALALDSQKNLYVCDSMGGFVLKLSPEGAPLKQFGNGLFRKPAGLAINEGLDRIYVSDALENQIVVFDMSGEHLFSFSQGGASKASLFAPQGIAIDNQNRIFVADSLNARVQVFDAEGNHLYQIGERGDQVFDFEAPRGVAFDSDGNLWVVDARKAAIMIYTPEGDLLLHFVSSSKDVMHPLSLGFPNAIAIDENDQVYVSDLAYLRFMKLQFLSKKFLAKHPITEEEKQLQLRLLNEQRVRGK